MALLCGRAFCNSRTGTNFDNTGDKVRNLTSKRWLVAFVLALVAAVGPSQVAQFAAAGEVTPTPTWVVKQFTLEGDGRTYFAKVPSCEPMTTQVCVDFMTKPRSVLTYLHGSGAPEDLETAKIMLNAFQLMQRETIFVYGVSLGDTKKWDAGICCTLGPVDDVDYLVRTVRQLDNNYAVNLNRVGLFGGSNGGMMALKGACERADVFKAGASFAGNYSGMCDKTLVKVAQWHGSADTVIPLNGGWRYVNGVRVYIPPAADLGRRMLPGQMFPVVVLTGVGHQVPVYVFRLQINWLASQFVG